jgi:glycogen operon protein
VATRISGSSDLFGDDRRKPWHSINFITAHDGFTLTDLVSYNHKHNWANAEDNRDGNSYNLSWNAGVEGVSRDPAVLALRHRQARNLLALLLVSQGTPMIHAGDEFGFSKKGNNNTYCHDSRLNWLDWTLREKNHELWAFTQFLLGLRKSHPGLRRSVFFDGAGDVVWTAPGGGLPDWSAESRSLAVRISGHRKDTGGDWDAPDLWIALHAHWDPREFRLPPARKGSRWVKVVDTGTSPGFFRPEEAPACGAVLGVPGRTLVMAMEMAYTEA